MDLSSTFGGALDGLESSSRRLDAQPAHPPLTERLKQRVKRSWDQYIPSGRISMPKVPGGSLFRPRRESKCPPKSHFQLFNSRDDMAKTIQVMTGSMVGTLQKKSSQQLQRLGEGEELAKLPIVNDRSTEDRDQSTSPKTSPLGSFDLQGVGSRFPPPYEALGGVRMSLESIPPDLEESSSNIFSFDNDDDSRDSPESHLEQAPQGSRPLSALPTSCRNTIDPIQRISSSTTWGTNCSDTANRNSRDSVDVSRHSIFSVGPSVSSSCSSLAELVAGAIPHAPRVVTTRAKAAPPSSSLNNEIIPSPDSASGEDSVANIPAMPPARSNIPGLGLNVSDDVAERSWAAYLRRSNKRSPAAFEEDGSDQKKPPVQPPFLDPRSERGPKGNADPSDSLSTIDEGHSDAGCSSQGANIPLFHTDDAKMETQSAQWAPDQAVTTTSESVINHRPVSSEFSKPPDTTPGTSILERADAEDSDMPDLNEDEEGDDDDDEDDDGYNSDSFSEITEETDNSLSKTFAGMSLEPVLTSLAITLQDQIVSIVVRRVTSWATSYSMSDDPGGGPSRSSGSPVNPQPDHNNGGGSSSQGSGGNGGGKRDFDGRESGSTGRGSGDDSHKRRRTDTPAQDSVSDEEHKSFACPFAKRYPERAWPKTCIRGWREVHRIKQHLYDRHMVPSYCYRCFATFKSEEKLEQHARQEPQCEISEKPAEPMIGISKATKDKLKPRKNIQTLSDEGKWENIYKIMFPEVQPENIPSPYFDIEPLASSMNAQDLRDFRQIMQGSIPRVIGGIQERLVCRPEIQRSGVTVRELSDVIHKGVWDAFEHVFPTMVVPMNRPSALTGRCQKCGCAESPRTQLETPAIVNMAVDDQGTQGNPPAEPALEDVGMAGSSSMQAGQALQPVVERQMEDDMFSHSLDEAIMSLDGFGEISALGDFTFSDEEYRDSSYG